MAAPRKPRTAAGRSRNSRPAPRAGAARQRAGGPVRTRPRLTNRAAILLIVFAVLVVSYASSMRAYLRQQAHIAALKEQIRSSSADIARAEREKRRWEDPAYVRAQTRERFGWVLPGETAYVVLDRDGKPLAGGGHLDEPSSLTHGTPTAWWTKVDGTLQAADHPQAKARPQPATEIKPPASTR